MPSLEWDHPIEVQSTALLGPIESEPKLAPLTYSTEPEADSSDEASQLFIDHFPHGSPGAPILGACQGSSLYHSSQEAFRDSNWAPFCSQCDWEIAHWAKMRAPTSSAMEDLLAIPSVCVHSLATVTFIPRAPQKTPQNNDATKAADLKRRARDIARDSHGIEDEIRAMVSSYMAPKDDEDQELAIGRLVC